MNILLVETSPLGKNTDVTVHVRNSLILEDYLKNQGHNCQLVSEIGNIDLNTQYDFIIFISSTFYFPFNPFITLINNQINCKIGWISNEFESFCNNFLKQIGLDFIITNFVKDAIKKSHKHDKHLMTNLNAFQAKARNKIWDKQYDLCYYGCFRKYREKYFQKYLVKDIILSTSSKNIKKFMLIGCDSLVTDKFSWKVGEETLNLFWATLGIEDTKTHKWFNYLPNRWFESLFCNTAIFFDKSCQNTIDKDVFKIDKWFIVDSYDEIISKVTELKNGLNIETHFNINTNIALTEKDKTLEEIEKFLLNY